LQIADYRRFWSARFLSWLSGSGMVVIIGYQLYDLARQSYGMSITQASFMLGVLGFVQFVPMFLLTPISGVVADRFDRRKVGAMAICVDMTMALIMAVATWQVAVAAAGADIGRGQRHGARFHRAVGGRNCADDRAAQPVAPRHRDEFHGDAIGHDCGPAVAGMLFAWHPSLFYWIASVLLCVSALALLTIRPLPAHAANRDVHPCAWPWKG
jgi:hypothetical protein